MALFRRNGPVVFEPHGYRRRRAWRIPRWLVFLLLGIVAGAGGLLYVQQEYLPQRLSPEESHQLRTRLEQVDAERQRLQSALDGATRKAEASDAEGKRLASELATARQSVDRLQKDLVLFDDVLPPDPRGGAIEVRAARFANDSGRLAYHVLLTRENRGKAFRGVIEFVVAGERASGRSETITLDPVEVTLASYEHARGLAPLPEGFLARQVTIRVLDAPAGRMQGMRVINVR